MKPLGDPKTHFWKVQDMAKATDTNLVEAFEAGKMTSEEWAGMVERCRSCQWVEGCERWLSRHEDGGAEPPVDCVNHKRFEALKSELDQSPL